MAYTADKAFELIESDTGGRVWRTRSSSAGRTAVGNDWLAERLAMGHGSPVSTLLQKMRQDEEEEKTLRRYGKIHKI